jgi:hypothetical protein
VCFSPSWNEDPGAHLRGSRHDVHSGSGTSSWGPQQPAGNNPRRGGSPAAARRCSGRRRSCEADKNGEAALTDLKEFSDFSVIEDSLAHPSDMEISPSALVGGSRPHGDARWRDCPVPIDARTAARPRCFLSCSVRHSAPISVSSGWRPAPGARPGCCRRARSGAPYTARRSLQPIVERRNVKRRFAPKRLRRIRRLFRTLQIHAKRSYLPRSRVSPPGAAC